MPLLDRFKEQAAQAAQKAQEAAQKGQAKLDEAQAKRREDGLLRELGALVYDERTGAASAGENSSAEIERLVGAITEQRAAREAAREAAAAVGADASTPSAGDGSPGDDSNPE